MKVKILFDSVSERNYISRRAQNILNLEPLNFEKLKINTCRENSKVTTVQRVNFLIKTADKNWQRLKRTLHLLFAYLCRINHYKSHENILNIWILILRMRVIWVEKLIFSYVLTGEIKFCDSEGLVAVNSLFKWMLCGSIGVELEDLATTSLHSIHVLFSWDIVGYESLFKDADVLEIKNRSTVNLANTDHVSIISVSFSQRCEN